MYSYRRFSPGAPGLLPPAIKNIMYVNGVIFLMQMINPSLENLLFNLFALSQSDLIFQFKIWQLATYMFLHGNFMHIFFNMFILWMFGAELEREWGTRQFLKYYFICGIGAGITVILVSPFPTIGASGAVYGIMIAFAIRFPDAMIIFPFPAKVKYYVGFYFLFSLFMTMSSAQDGIAHGAHLGGMVVGLLYLKYPYISSKLKSLSSNMNRSRSSGKKSASNMRFTSGGDDKTEYYRKKIDDLLDKINRVGYLNLTDEEKKLLEEGSKYLREHDKENYN
jgi:membrane associated rhomboid family serine protease